MSESSTDPVRLPHGLKESVLKFVDVIGGTRWGQRSLLKFTEIAQASMGAGNYDDTLQRTGELRLIAAINKAVGPITAIDIGAHHGAWSLAVLANSAQNKVVALEPDPRSFTSLSEAVSALPQVFAINAGVSDQDGEQTLFVDQGNSQLSTLLPAMLQRVPESTQGLDQAEVTVHVKRMSSVLEEAISDGFITSGDQVNFIKIDTEGLEFPILQQVINVFDSSCPAIQFEFNSHALASGQLIDDFRKILGEKFKLFRLAPRKLIPRSDLSFSAANAAGFSNWVALHRSISQKVEVAYRKAH